MNAYTSFDRTVYYINVPNTGASVAVDILWRCHAERHVATDELAKELDVIRREMDMGQDDPGSRASRRLFEVALHEKPVSLHHHRLPGHLQPTPARRLRAYYENVTRRTTFSTSSPATSTRRKWRRKSARLSPA